MNSCLPQIDGGGGPALLVLHVLHAGRPLEAGYEGVQLVLLVLVALGLRNVLNFIIDRGGHPYMTSTLRGEGVSPKEDVVREVA